ncbi:hypothetical protein MLD38_002895 [Melastoma candidum]|uniref:Uncharacterized protein n=1 Tax=Melastoma candidum TaxID=119954 RepID=A0ACB9S0K5_9MYRT|nr:hypothetical protein MLD38_002895 [Melastoma candidum]
MIAMIESAMAVRFPSGSTICSSSCVPCYRSLWSSEESAGVHIGICRRSSLDVTRNWNSGPAARRKSSNVRKKVRAAAEHLGSVPDPVKCNGSSGYHPFENITELAPEINGEACLTPAEITRTIVEVNDKATLLFSGMVNEEVHESVVWPDLPYMNDECGNIYFQVKTEEDILQSIASEDNIVQIVIGLDATELINDMGTSGPAEGDFGIEEIDDEDDDVEDMGDEDNTEDSDGNENDDYYQDWVPVLEGEDYSNLSGENPGDWATLGTMRSAHPMSFAKKLAEVASEEPADLMEGPPVGICIQGVLRPALLEEHLIIKKHFSNKNGDGKISAWDLDKGNISRKEISYYTLDLVKIHLLSVQGHPDMPTVAIEDFLKAKPDAIAHSAADIVSRLKADGEKTLRALKALCWRCKGIQVEEAQIIGVDSLGFDTRVCSGTQLQTLRFAFDAQATSVHSAERKLNNLLFPGGQPKPRKVKHIHLPDS